jgi:hypothetical protein
LLNGTVQHKCPKLAKRGCALSDLNASATITDRTGPQDTRILPGELLDISPKAIEMKVYRAPKFSSILFVKTWE